MAENLRCLERNDTCAGPVEYRTPLSATGKPYPRCDAHWDKRLATQQRVDRDYPDQPVPPSGFDPSYAGERWGEDY